MEDQAEILQEEFEKGTELCKVTRMEQGVLDLLDKGLS